MKFKSPHRLDVWVASKGVSLTVDGEYETTDKDEIAALEAYGVQKVATPQTKSPAKKKATAKKKG